MTNTSRLVAELKRRYGSPRNVLTRLGLDADILAEFKPGNGASNGGKDDALTQFRRAVAEAIEQASEANTISDRYRAKMENLLFADPENPADIDAAEDEERKPSLSDEELRALLREKGLGDDDLDEFFERFRGGDKAPAARRVLDEAPLPRNAQRNGYGGAAAAMDSAFIRRHPEAARVGCAPAPRPRRRAVDIGDFASRHPGVARVYLG